MGNDTPKPKPRDPQEEIQDAILNMKLTAKQFEHAAKRAEKDQKKQMDNAKTALKKNNEEGARMFLQSATTKFRESQNYVRMAHRMEALSAVLQSNTSNQQLMQTLRGLTPMLTMQSQSMDFNTMQKNLSEYQDAMDKLTVAGKIMDSSLNQQTYDESSDKGVDNMLTQMKQEMMLEIQNNLMSDPSIDFVALDANNQSDLNKGANTIKKTGQTKKID